MKIKILLLLFLMVGTSCNNNIVNNNIVNNNNNNNIVNNLLNSCKKVFNNYKLNDIILKDKEIKKLITNKVQVIDFLKKNNYLYIHCKVSYTIIYKKTNKPFNFYFNYIIKRNRKGINSEIQTIRI